MYIFGGNHRKRNKPQYTGLAVQTSSSVIPIAIGFGKNRAAANIIWQDDFQSHKQSTHTGKGGGGSGNVTYTYSGSYQLSLGWGQVSAIGLTWKDQSKVSDYASLGFTLIAGAIPQAPWGYLTTNHPSAALGYPGQALLCVSNFNLGDSNSLPQFSFEVSWPLVNTAPGGNGDADPAQCIDQLLNSSIFGILGGNSLPLDGLFSTSAAPTTGDAAYQTYCQAMGFGMSPLLDSQENCLSVLDRWTQIFNTRLNWTGYSLLFEPYSADTITGNGVTYLPDTTIEFSLGDDDFMRQSNGDPLFTRRQRQSAFPNAGSLEIRNRGNEYNTEPAPWQEQGPIDTYGLLVDSSYKANEICEPSIGAICAALYGQRRAYSRNQYEGTLGSEYLYLIPGSKGTITDTKLGTLVVRVVEMEEDDSGNFKMIFEDYFGSLGSAPAASAEPTTGTALNTNIAPDSANAPIILEPPSTLAGSAQIWIAASGGAAGIADPNWGGCYVWLSGDGGASYQMVGQIDSAARMGALTSSLASYGGANPDTGHTFGVDLSESAGDLTGVTSGEAAAAITLCAIKDAGGSVEYLSFRDATLTATYKYTLGGQLYRGLYGSSAGAHSIGAVFARLDQNIFKYDLPAAWIGQTIFAKLQSFNIYGEAVQDISACTPYSYSPSGAGYGGGSGGVPTTPATPTVAASGAVDVVSWTANPSTDNVIRYDVFRANGTGASFGLASKIGSSTGTSYSDATVASSTAYTYFIEAVNAIGASSPSLGASISSSAGAAIDTGFAFECFNPTAGKPIAYFKLPFAWTMPSGLTGSTGEIGDSDTASKAAPTAQTDFDIQSPIGTSIGTMRFAASSLTPTFIKASSSSIPANQDGVILAPSNLNGLAGAIFGSLKGTR